MPSECSNRERLLKIPAPFSHAEHVFTLPSDIQLGGNPPTRSHHEEEGGGRKGECSAGSQGCQQPWGQFQFQFWTLGITPPAHSITSA